MNKPILTTSAQITDWCVNHIANLLGTEAGRIDPEADFDRLGLDSALAVSMLLDLEEQLGDMHIPPELLFEYTTIAEMAEHLERELARRRSAEQAEVA